MFRPSVWKVVKTKKVLFSKINMSLLPFFYFFLWRKKWILGPFCDFGPNAKMVFFPFLLWIFFNEYIFLVQTHVRWDYRGRTGGNLNEFILLIGPIVVCRGLNRPCGAWPLLVTHYWIFCRQGSWSPEPGVEIFFAAAQWVGWTSGGARFPPPLDPWAWVQLSFGVASLVLRIVS